MKIRVPSPLSPLSPLGGCWPNPEQELLLQAALFQGERSIRAWNLWKKSTDIETKTLDLSSFRLLPLVYRNLCDQGLSDPLMEKLKGIYRLHWYKNQRLFHNTTPVLKSFHAAGIKTMILKGAALSLKYYRDYGVRAMGDFDALVPTRQSLEAVALLRSLGWSSKWDLPEEYRFLRHSQPFRGNGDCELDFHWHILSGNPANDADDDFWEGAREVKIQDVSTQTLNPADQLLHVCVHGAVWDAVPHVRWVADAMVILKVAQSEIDWSRLLVQAQKCRVAMPLRETFAYLRDKFDAPISTEILRGLQNTPVSKSECQVYRYSTSPPTFFSVLVKYWLINSRLTGEVGFWKKLMQFSKNLPYWNMPPLWKLPFHIIFRGIRKLGRITLGYASRFLKKPQATCGQPSH